MCEPDAESERPMANLPFATEIARPLEGALKHEPADFFVEEIPAYEPVGRGDHLFVLFEKTGLDSKTAIRRLAQALGTDPRDAGSAGLKDRHAVTRQWASFLRGDPAKLENLELEGVRVLRADRHGNKLRTGHLHGNRFVIRLRNERTSLEDEQIARAVLESLSETGVPNYYGEQRFGREQQNLTRAHTWLILGGKPPRELFDKKLLVSTLQSELFNRLCAARVEEGLLGDIIAGDLCRKEETGGLFVAQDPSVERERAARFEISATGPMFGASMRWPEADALERERAVLIESGLDDEKLKRFAKWGEGTRRSYRVRLQDARVERDEQGLIFSFVLPPGAYATVVLRELTRQSGEERAAPGQTTPGFGDSVANESTSKGPSSDESSSDESGAVRSSADDE